MKAWLRGFYYSLPIQLLSLHFRKYQALLIFWFVLFSTINGSFMKAFGAGSLFLAPEYLGNVNMISFSIVGIAIGMFIMSWHVTTFILFSRHFKFLAATSNPFLRYCINNSIIPLIFLLFYLYNAWHFSHYNELIPSTDVFFLLGGFLFGLFFMLLISIVYFFRADRNILRRMAPDISHPAEYFAHLKPLARARNGEAHIRCEWYLYTPIHVKKPRNVAHYSQQFLDNIFKRHHFAAVVAVFIAFIFLMLIGYLLDYPFFQLPAAASSTIFFAILIGVAGAFTYFLQSWSIPYLIGLILLLNLFYKMNWIDPRNKAYGLNYTNKAERPSYSRNGLLQLCNPTDAELDRQNMIGILNKWKQKQNNAKPLLLLITTSGGGNRSAAFTMNALQQLDSATHGDLMKSTFLMTGASGGMLSSAYFRELYLQKIQGKNINLHDRKYVDEIAGDLLNPIFTSFVARDLIAPAQKFKVGSYTYIKDRGYAFEEKLNENTEGLLNKKISDYTAEEANANIPLVFFNSVVSRDGKKMIVSTQPIRFMMRPMSDSSHISIMDPDAIDFGSFFKKQDPYNLRILSALRMNATFPIVLPNVWLPSSPVVDVMDAGLRDNFGQETALRFLENFDGWIKENTSGVLIIQLRDHESGGWDNPYYSDDMTEHITKPFFLLQNNWYKMMDYFQNDQLSYYSKNSSFPVYRITFHYGADSEEKMAALNFHLTQNEKNNIRLTLNSAGNKKGFQLVQQFLTANDSAQLKPVE